MFNKFKNKASKSILFTFFVFFVAPISDFNMYTEAILEITTIYKDIRNYFNFSGFVASFGIFAFRNFSFVSNFSNSNSSL